MSISSSKEDDKIAANAIRELNDLLPSLQSIAVEARLAAASAVGFGWWMRILRTAKGVGRMHAADLSQEASPLLRTILHHTAALEWLRRCPDEVLQALKHEHARRRQSLSQKAKARDWDLKGTTLGPPPRENKPPGLVYLDRFEKLCEHIEVPNLYVAYMVESTYAHASALSADVYLDLDARGHTRLRDSPRNSGVPLKATAMFAATATNICGDLLQDDRLTKTSEAVGVRLSVPVTLGSASDGAV